MIDEILQELWNAKDNIAKEHSYNIDKLSEYYTQKQIDNSDKSHQGYKNIKGEQGVHSGALDS